MGFARKHPSFVALEGAEKLNSASLSADGRRVVTSSSNDAARVWDLRGSQPSFIALEGHALIMAASFSPDGSHVVTASIYRTARVWDLRGEWPSYVALEGHEAEVTSASFSADGSHVVTTSADGTARVWRMFQDADELVLLVRSKLSRCLSQLQRTTYGLAARQVTSDDRHFIPPPTPDGRCAS